MSTGKASPDNAKTNQNCSSSSNNADKEHNKINVTPAQALIIGGILTGVLDVFSFLVDIHQNIEITLVGNFKHDVEKKSDLNTTLDSLGSVPLDEILKAIINRLS